MYAKMNGETVCCGLCQSFAAQPERLGRSKRFSFFCYLLSVYVLRRHHSNPICADSENFVVELGRCGILLQTLSHLYVYVVIIHGMGRNEMKY